MVNFPREKVNVLVVGSGGREHALAWKIGKSRRSADIFVAPGNGGTYSNNVDIAQNDIAKLRRFALERDCLTVVGPETPLSNGIVDEFSSCGAAIFGPTAAQAQLESSKSFAKNFMKETGIPTAKYGVFSDANDAIAFAYSFGGRVAVKADGLVSGKGVCVCSSMDQATEIISRILDMKIFGSAGERIVVEERLFGPEVSFFALCDGKHAVGFGTAADHKRLLAGERGPNTGGMGAYSPAIRGWDEDKDSRFVLGRIVSSIVGKAGYKGILFVGLIMTDEGPKVLEFNCRMGDPEAQALLPRLRSDLLSLIISALEGDLSSSQEILWDNRFSCCVVMSSRGYPSQPKVGDQIAGEVMMSSGDTLVFHSGTKMVDGNRFQTAGGRVLGVTGLGPTLRDASTKAYQRVSKITWEGEYHRADIADILNQEKPAIYESN